MPEDTRRYYGLDALRGSMMMLGIVLHGSQWYLSEPPAGLPIPTDHATAYVFDVLVHFIHSFRMPLFFVLAGFFTSLLVGKRGIPGTYRNRASRILLPLLFACVAILPFTALFAGAFMVSARFDAMILIPTAEQLEILVAELTDAGLPVMDSPSIAHLWFLYYLLYFYLTIPLCYLLAALLQRQQRAWDRLIASPLMALVLVALTAASLQWFRAGVVFEGFVFLKPHLPSLIYYGSFFIVGYLFHHHRLILETFRRHVLVSGLLSAVLLPAAIWSTAVELHATAVTDPIHWTAVVINAALTWSLIYFFMGLFLRFLDYQSPWILYISNSSYWVYLVHMPVISLAAWLMWPVAVPAVVKFLVITSFTTLVCFTSYQYLVQRSWLSALLNGMRFDHPWPWQAPAHPT